jgi:hypothetical protein
MGPLENRCCADGEIQLALIAAVEATLASRDAILTGASWAGNPIRPKAGLKVNPRCLLVGEHCEKLEGRNCALAHEPIVDNSLEGVKYYFDVLHIYCQKVRYYCRYPLGASEPQDGRNTSGTNPEEYKGQTMDIHKYFSAAQAAELDALAKSLEELRNIKMPAAHLDLSSHTIDPALFTHVW